ncbi:retrovirus-related pol polyprotein from transposon TNT 1-94 [Tanacetum coccineum]
MASSTTRCDDALETLPADMEAGEKDDLMKKGYNTLIICLGDRGLYLKKKKLYTYYMSLYTKLSDHIDEFHRLILDLANIDIEVEDEDQALMLLTSLPSSYENFVETFLCGREFLTMEHVLTTLNSRELKKRTEGTKEETSNGLYVRGRSNHSEGQLKRYCLMKKSSGFVRKGTHDHDSDSFDDEGNAYFGEALVVVKNDEMTKLVMGLCWSYHMTYIRDLLYNFKDIDGGSVQLDDNRTCTIKGTRKVKIKFHDGSSFILEEVYDYVDTGNSWNSNETLLARLSCDVYVTNLPSHFTVRELRNVCERFGIFFSDVFITKKLSKLGKHFAFVRYLKVNDAKTIIDGLCNTRIVMQKIFANITHFDCKDTFVFVVKNKMHAHVSTYNVKGMGNSAMMYANVVQEWHEYVNYHQMNGETVVILDGGCLKDMEASLTVFACVKEFRSRTNMRSICKNAGFHNVKLKYLGGLGEFEAIETCMKFQKHAGVQS